jgi:hypothetical protein
MARKPVGKRQAKADRPLNTRTVRGTLMTGWYSLEVMKANKLRRQAKELELTIRRSRSGLQLVNKYGAIVLGKKKGATVGEIAEHLDFIERRALWGKNLNSSKLAEAQPLPSGS